MPKTSPLADIRAHLDELFALRIALAEHERERNVAILRLLPSELQETIAGVMQEFQDLLGSRTQAEEQCKAQIQAEVRRLGCAVRGTHLQATYGKGRKKWHDEQLLALAHHVPEITACLSEGEPLVAIRVCAQRERTSPLLYDTHVG